MEPSSPERTYLQSGRGVVTTRSQAITMETKLAKQKARNNHSDKEDGDKSWKGSWFSTKTVRPKKITTTESLF